MDAFKKFVLQDVFKLPLAQDMRLMTPEDIMLPRVTVYYDAITDVKPFPDLRDENFTGPSKLGELCRERFPELSHSEEFPMYISMYIMLSYFNRLANIGIEKEELYLIGQRFIEFFKGQRDHAHGQSFNGYSDIYDDTLATWCKAQPEGKRITCYRHYTQEIDPPRTYYSLPVCISIKDDNELSGILVHAFRF